MKPWIRALLDALAHDPVALAWSGAWGIAYARRLAERRASEARASREEAPASSSSPARLAASMATRARRRSSG